MATKVPPKNRKWPSRRGFTLDECFPPDYIREYAEKSLRNLELTRIDLLQFHVWEDAWAHDERWQRAIEDLKRQGLIRAVGISINRWEPANVLETLRTGLIDAVQVIYNIFDQAPQDELFPLCRELNVGVIARVPFDEGTLTGTLTKDSPMARGGLAEQLLRAREPRGERRPRRGPPAARPARDDDARAGPALDPGRPDGLDHHPGDAEAASTSRPTSPPATASRSTPRCWSSSRPTAGTGRRRNGRSERRSRAGCAGAEVRPVAPGCDPHECRRRSCPRSRRPSRPRPSSPRRACSRRSPEPPRRWPHPASCAGMLAARLAPARPLVLAAAVGGIPMRPATFMPAYRLA